MNDSASGRPLQIAVIGAGRCDEALASRARAVGTALARAGAVLVCGGGGGVMAAASQGAREVGGLAVGVLPGTDASTSPPNPALGLALFSGLGQARNVVVVLSGAAVIAVGGGWGTLSEIALARKHGRPVVLLDSWMLHHPSGHPDPGLHQADDPEAAVTLALTLAAQSRVS